MSSRYFVAVGSNLDDRRALIQAAIDQLDASAAITVEARAAIWETRPVGPGTGPYLNTAISIVSALAPEALLDHLVAVESSLGRVRRQRWGDRHIDLDLIAGFDAGGDEIVVDSEGLELPHPRVHGRDFVLQPLVELDAKLRVGGRRCRESLAALGDEERTLLRVYTHERTEPMKIDLTGKTALVTGSTKGIGFATAKAFAGAGAAVIVHGRTAQQVSDQAACIGARGIAADLGTPEGCEQLAAEAGEVDILVNNAGIFQPCDFFDTDDAEWDRHWQVNVMSAMRLSRALAPAMVRRGWGRIVMLGSESSFNIPTDMIHYGVSKAADVALARGLAKRLAGTGVTVNSVLPGPTLSDGLRDMLADRVARTGKDIEDVAAEFVMEARPSSIIRRAASVEEVAHMIIYACSPQASATTGASLRVDGGVVETL